MIAGIGVLKWLVSVAMEGSADQVVPGRAAVTA
jgi:hypothetical protein